MRRSRRRIWLLLTTVVVVGCSTEKAEEAPAPEEVVPVPDTSRFPLTPAEPGGRVIQVLSDRVGRSCQPRVGPPVPRFVVFAGGAMFAFTDEVGLYTRFVSLDLMGRLQALAVATGSEPLNALTPTRNGTLHRLEYWEAGLRRQVEAYSLASTALPPSPAKRPPAFAATDLSRAPTRRHPAPDVAVRPLLPDEPTCADASP